MSRVLENWRNSIIETPLREFLVRSTSTLYVWSAHAITFSAGSASYGNQSAAAAPEVVCWSVSFAKIAVRCPHSAKRTPSKSRDAGTHDCYSTLHQNDLRAMGYRVI